MQAILRTLCDCIRVVATTLPYPQEIHVPVLPRRVIQITDKPEPDSFQPTRLGRRIFKLDKVQKDPFDPRYDTAYYTETSTFLPPETP